MAPMTRGRADDRHAPTAINVLYYAQRAGAGMIVTEGTPPDSMGQGYLGVPGIYTPEQVAGWREVTAAVHRQGAAIFQQLMHVGRVSHPSFLNGEIPVGPSAIAVTEGQIYTASGPQPFVTLRALARHEVAEVIGTYGRASRLAADAGFDGVELHATSGYLPSQFLLPTMIANGGYDRSRAEADLAAGRADLISFGKSFLANPDLPERLALNAPLNAPDFSFFYGGGAKGYTDYSALEGYPPIPAVSPRPMPQVI